VAGVIKNLNFVSRGWFKTKLPMKPSKIKPGFLTLLLMSCLGLSAQQVSLINLDQLYDRVNHGQDTTFIINFWAEWCAPCVKELPDFIRFSREHKNEKLKVLLINVDFRSKLKTSVLAFIKRNGIKNEVFLLNERDPQIYIDRIDSSWSGALPATLLIKDRRRKFFEKEFTYSELLYEYKHY
jgi:thiol-disulfide isomerase/thioredoxin